MQCDTCLRYFTGLYYLRCKLTDFVYYTRLMYKWKHISKVNPVFIRTNYFICRQMISRLNILFDVILVSL